MGQSQHLHVSLICLTGEHIDMRLCCSMRDHRHVSRGATPGLGQTIPDAVRGPSTGVASQEAFTLIPVMLHCTSARL